MTNLSINGKGMNTQHDSSLLHPELHQEILFKAVELAISLYSRDNLREAISGMDNKSNNQ
jgi:hypothetical protein